MIIGSASGDLKLAQNPEIGQNPCPNRNSLGPAHPQRNRKTMTGKLLYRPAGVLHKTDDATLVRNRGTSFRHHRSHLTKD
jgi:hypothetical protein